MKNVAASQPRATTAQVLAIPTTIIATDAHGRRQGASFVLVELPDGSLSSLEGCRTYDRQQLCKRFGYDA